jgi:hypothetical protein
VARRRLIVKHIDPFTVLKFGAILNAAGFLILMIASVIVWVVIVRIGLIDRSCDIASDVGFADCGLSSVSYFLAATLLSLLWAVVQTAMFVFLAFLHNLIADLTGGLSVSVVVEGLPDRSAARRSPDPKPYLRDDRSVAGPGARREPPIDPDETRRMPGSSRRDDPPRGGLFDPR